MPKVLITGVVGQDGSYLAEFLLKKGYDVTGLYRRSSTPNFSRLHGFKQKIELVEGDVTDFSSMLALCSKYKFDEIYNLAAQSHVATSFNNPIYTAQVNYIGCLNLLEIMRHLKAELMEWGVTQKFYQASTSEMYGSNYSNIFISQVDPATGCNKDGINWKDLKPDERYSEYRFQNEKTPFAPNSPYAIAKLAAHNAVRMYRESYGLHASCGILFNHESPRRGEEFVTRKIIKFVKKLQTLKVTGWPWFEGEKLKLGNLSAQRDWGYAPDYVEGMWMMLQQDNPDDYVLATGETHTVEEFLAEAFNIIKEDWHDFVGIDPTLKRPSEVPFLRGDAGKAKEKLGWTPKTTFKDLVRIMLDNEA